MLSALTLILFIPNYTNIDNVLDNLTVFYQDKYYPRFDRYFWNMETNIQEIYADLKKQRDVIRSKNEEEKKRDRCERAKREYEAALKETELLDKVKKSLR